MSYRRHIADRNLYAKHAAPESIVAALRSVGEVRKRASEEYDWLNTLYEKRKGQIDRGEWPRQDRA